MNGVHSVIYKHSDVLHPNKEGGDSSCKSHELHMRLREEEAGAGVEAAKRRWLKKQKESNANEEEEEEASFSSDDNETVIANALSKTRSKRQVRT